MKKKLALSLTALVFSVLLTFSVILAWFLRPDETGSVITYSGDIDLITEIYAGLDDNNDGILNEVEADTSTRAAKLDNQYVPLKGGYFNDINGKTIFEGIYPGRCITYKIVIKNESASKKAASVDIRLADLTDYFYTAVTSHYLDKNGVMGANENAALSTLFENNSVRLFFQISNIKITSYSNENNDNFNTQTSQDSPESAPLPLWKYSEGQNFISSARVEYGELIEIDYRFACVFSINEINEYSANAESLYYSRLESLIGTSAYYTEANIKAAISKITTKEIEFILGQETQVAGTLCFKIKSVRVRGTQLN